MLFIDVLDDLQLKNVLQPIKKFLVEQKTYTKAFIRYRKGFVSVLVCNLVINTSLFFSMLLLVTLKVEVNHCLKVP